MGHGDGSEGVTVELARIAADHDVDPSSVALAFVLRHPSGPVPILGTQQVSRIRAATEALSIELTRTEWYTLYQAGTGERLP